MGKIILVFTVLFGFNGIGQIQTRKVLFLGNSYTYFNDLPQIVSALATNTGDILIYDSNLIGAATLEDHAASIISQNKILSNDWDYIVLQEQSQRPAFLVPVGFMDGFSDLNNFISQNKPCAQITSFMTWAHENGDTQNCVNNPNVCTYLGMHNLIRDRYMSFSTVYESEVTPVGVVWKYIKDNYPSINLYQSDGSHPSLAGSYLAACCFYTSLFRKDPTLISNNYGLDANTAQVIRNATKSLVFDQLLTWYIGKYVPNSDFNYTIGNGYNEVIFDISSSAYQDSVEWDFGDGTTSLESNPAHNYTTNGNYTIKLTAVKCFLNQNFESITEKTVNFCSHTNSIYPNNLILCPNTTDVIWTQLADNYQWLDYLGNPIAGATNQSLEVYSGSYSVITTINGCAERSPEMFVDQWIMNPYCDLSNGDIERSSEIIIYPNPTQETINFYTQGTIVEISVYDILSNKVIVDQISVNSLNVSNLSQGIYLIKAIDQNDKVLLTKFIKQ